jgi:histidinol-phosphate phosphatase family protein
MRWPDLPDPARAMAADRVLFIDRDGVLIVEKDYLRDPAQVELVAGVPEALRAARAAGYALVGLSNQSGLGRGRFTPAQFAAVMGRLEALLADAGCALDAFFYCPHAPEHGCHCRKPAPGLLEEAARCLAWDAARSWMLGDKISDVDLALGAGLRPVLVRTGYGREQESQLGDRAGVLVAADLPAAVAGILAEGSP